MLMIRSRKMVGIGWVTGAGLQVTDGVTGEGQMIHKEITRQTEIPIKKKCVIACFLAFSFPTSQFEYAYPAVKTI